MKPKRFILVALAVAIMGFALWWFIQQPIMSAKADAPALSKAEAPEIVAPPTIAPPVAPSAPKPDATPVAATQSATAAPAQNSDADPQADLKTAIPDIVRLTRAGDYLGIYLTYTPPDKLDPQKIQEMHERQPAKQDDEENALPYEALENQTPTFDDAGDEATYMYPMPAGNYSTYQIPLTFIKINGKWYIKSGK